MEISWLPFSFLLYVHISALYGLFLLFTKVKLASFLFGYFLGVFSTFGVTSGAHRLWSHKTYKAKWPLRLLLMILHTFSGQKSIYLWARDHRVHHKYTDTNADPYNAKRGFFFSHVGWLLVKRHPDVIAKSKCIDMSDLKADPIVMFQKKYYYQLWLTLSFFLPIVIMVYFWSETVWTAFNGSILRYVIQLNMTWTINSVAHMWGMKPYDKNITAVNNSNIIYSTITFGEGWHNYHHVFPWDYKASEFNKFTDWSTTFINFFAKIGWAYELKTVSEEIIRQRVIRSGDGSHEKFKKSEDINQNTNKFIEEYEQDKLIWGWDDKDINVKHKTYAKIYYNKAQEELAT